MVYNLPLSALDSQLSNSITLSFYIVCNNKVSNPFELLITSVAWVTVNQNHIIVVLCRKGRKCYLIDAIFFLYTNESFPLSAADTVSNNIVMEIKHCRDIFRRELK